MIRSMNAKKMVQNYIAPRGISDEKVLQAMMNVPRHTFVPETLHERAYSDHPLPIGFDQTISQPYIVALMTQALNLQGHERVLELGTGSGYQAAILARIVKSVFSVERIHPLAVQARKNLEANGIFNVSVQCSNGDQGWKEYAPYDRIIVTATMEKEPLHLMDQLTQGGILVAPILEGGQEMLYRYTKTDAQIQKEFLCRCSFVPFVTS